MKPPGTVTPRHFLRRNGQTFRCRFDLVTGVPAMLPPAHLLLPGVFNNRRSQPRLLYRPGHDPVLVRDEGLKDCAKSVTTGGILTRGGRLYQMPVCYTLNSHRTTMTTATE